jgi:hypothetical protein
MPNINEIARATIVTNAVNKAAKAYLNHLKRENVRLRNLANRIKAANTLRGLKRKR